MKKAAIHNLGCKVNAYETEAMQQLLEQNGYEMVPFSEKADVYVVNTCSVTNMADKKSRQMLHRARKQNPDAVVVAVGCYVQTSKDQALSDGAADILIGNNKKHELIEMLREWEAQRAKKDEGRSTEMKRSDTDRSTEMERPDTDQGASGKRIADLIDINHGTAEYEELSVSRSAEHTRAFIKVQDGCNQFCSYCIIPYARGRVRSRSMESVLAEAGRLVQNGHQELVLTGIHLSSYGVDTGADLLELIKRIHEIEGVSRIRLGSLEPKIVTENFARTLSGLPKVCPHFHLSLQSGCDATLKRMNRKYSCREYRECCNYLREYFEHPAITTDVIVGFPGETEEEFETTRDFLREIAFFEIHVFKYSRRQGTKAADMDHQVPEEVKNERSAVLLGDVAKMRETFLSWYQGRDVEVLLEEEMLLDGRNCLVGHTPEYVKAAVLAEGHWANQKVSGTVTGRLGRSVLLLG